MIKIKTNNWEIKDIEAVLFDKDGTLIDSHIYWGRIIEKRSEALISYLSLPYSTFEELCYLMGYSQKTKKLMPQGPIALVSREKVIEALMEHFKKIKVAVTTDIISELFIKVHNKFLKELYRFTVPLPGAKDFIQKLRSRGIKTGVITTDSINNTKEIMEHLGLTPYFDLLMGKESSAHEKTSGKPAVEALEKLKVNPLNTVCIGDAPMDIIMGEKAGLKASIGIALGQIPESELKKITPYTSGSYEEMGVE